ncbi:Sec-independent protein translocase subunit TatA/TatB [Halostagnicola bangensis]
MNATAIPLVIPGGTELLIVLVVVILLFGARKLPQLARSTDGAMGEFRKGKVKTETELPEMRTDGTANGR